MLSKRTLDQAQPKDRPYILWHADVKGFGCKVHPTGKRTFIAQYRLTGSRKRYRVTLGAYGTIAYQAAENEARALLARVRVDPDPAATRRAANLAVSGLVEQYLLALNDGTASTSRSRGRSLAPGYVADTIVHLRRLADALGNRNANKLSRADVLRVLDPFKDQPSVHRRMHGAIGRMYAWAKARDLVSAAPTEGIETSSPASREHTLSLPELVRIWHAAEQVEPVYGDLVRLMIVTGQRRAEVARMQWSEIDLKAGLWTLPSARTKANHQHVIPLPSLALEVFHRRAATYSRGPAANDLVLPTISRDGRKIVAITGFNWLKRELDRHAGMCDWRLHDFRRSIVTLCAELGTDVAVLDSVLNHASSATRGGVIGVYQRATLLEPIRRALAQWDALLREAIGLPPAPERSIVRLAAVND